jgi:hypothetical protein
MNLGGSSWLENPQNLAQSDIRIVEFLSMPAYQGKLGNPSKNPQGFAFLVWVHPCQWRLPNDRAADEVMRHNREFCKAVR